MAFTDYRGLERWIPAPTGPAGIVLNDNFTELADRSGPIHSAAADPTVNDDQDDTAGNGKFYKYSKWLNTGTNDLYICIDSTATAAVWSRLHYDSIIDPDISNSLTIDSTQVLFLPEQVDFNGTIIVGNGGTHLSHIAGATGRYNIALGIDALEAITSGDSNVAIGDSTLKAVTTGRRNLALGYSTLVACTDGDHNVGVGDEALLDNIIGNHNVCIGRQAGESILGDDNVCIGAQAGRAEVGSNKLYIDCTDTATPLIYGEFDTNVIKIYGSLYIPSDAEKLYFGAGNDATISFDGNSLNIIANVVTGTDDLELTGQTIQMNGLTLATDKVMFTQVDGNEYIDSLNDGFIDYGATTAHRFLADVKLTADNRKLYFGAADTDYNITWDGNDAVHTITAGDFTFMGGNVGVNESAPQDKLEVNGTGLFKGRVKLTQDDGNEYIEGVTDNYVDIGATTAIRNNAAVLATDKVMFTQVDGNEYIDSLNDGFIDYGATTAHRFLNDVKITQDNDKLYFGVADDVSITYTGTKWVFDIEAITDLITMNPDGDDTDFVFGSSQLNDTGVVAQDKRMFFDKSQAAFRAGEAGGAAWDTRGNYSVAMGYNSIATGTCSTTFGNMSECAGSSGLAVGYSVKITSDNSFAHGYNTLADKYAQHAHSGGKFAARGDAQGSTFIARKSVVHNDAAWYPLFLDGTNIKLTLASNTVWTFDILIVGTTSGCTKSFGFKIEGVIENDGGTTTILASNVTTLYDADDTDFDARVSADDATDALKIEVTDATSGGDTVRWVAKISTVEVSF